MDRKEKAKDSDLISVISKAGYNPVRDTSTRAMYSSPFRGESVPSFVVYKKTNTWYDWGTGESGDTIDFIMSILNCSFKEAIDWILGGEELLPHKWNEDVVVDKPDGIDIIDVSDVFHDKMKEYALVRGVNELVLSLHCSQVTYAYASWDHVRHFAIGFKNIKGGWELRNHVGQKVSNSPKSWGMVRGSKETNECMVFEGFFDFLSYLSYWKMHYPEVNTYVLNSTVFVPMVVDELNEYEQVHLYMDNDAAAQNKIDEYLTGDKFIDHRHEYSEFNDYNDYVMNIND